MKHRLDKMNVLELKDLRDEYYRKLSKSERSVYEAEKVIYEITWEITKRAH